MFHIKQVVIGNASLQVFEGNNDSFTMVEDITTALNINPHVVLSQLGSALTSVPRLQTWLAEQGFLTRHTPQHKVLFLPSAAWVPFIKKHANSTLNTEYSQQDKVLEEEEAADPRSDSLGPPSPKFSSSQNVSSSSDSRSTLNPTSNNSSDCDTGTYSSSSTSSDSESHPQDLLPKNTPHWIMTEPKIPHQFSKQDYTKSYALKSYDISKTLQKELRKLRKWWTKPRNAERHAKAVHGNTMDKREERVLCFLGFVNHYKCLSSDLPLTLSLYLNHHLVHSFLDYLAQVRGSSEGTIGEALTAAIITCKWLYRKENTNTGGGGKHQHPPIVRRYMDYRNTHQANALRSRAENDVDELESQNRWIEWSEFIRLVSRLRNEWDSLDKDDPNGDFLEQAHTLHDLLLLGLYSCIPARGAEVRLLEYIPEEELKEHMDLDTKSSKSSRKPTPKLSLKHYVDKKQMNLLTCVDGVWKMYVAQYKVYHSHGVDVTELSPFGWWTDLFQLYHKIYRPLLLRHQNHNFIFVTRAGEPFTGSYFSDFISTLMYRHTGKRVATNLLRSSFVTYFYSSDAAQDPTARESVAAVMRHSVTQALKTYDRRSTSAKKRKGLHLLAEAGVANVNANANDVAHTMNMQDDEDVQVVLFKRMPHQIIHEEGGKFLLARMTRSSVSNAPLYFVEPNVTYEWQSKNQCTPLPGQWEDEGFLLL